jgi:hypothetical protein
MEYHHVNSKGVPCVIKKEEIEHLIFALSSYKVKTSDLKRLDSLFKSLETKTTMDEIIRNPIHPDWEINEILVTRIEWTGNGDSYKRKEFRELIQRNIEQWISALNGILKIIEKNTIKTHF